MPLTKVPLNAYGVLVFAPVRLLSCMLQLWIGVLHGVLISSGIDGDDTFFF
jgi:hypothetical protein